MNERSHTGGAPKLERERITVFRESPAWDTVERWFLLPRDTLCALYIATYEVTGEWIGPRDMERHAAEIRALHPNCVLIYLDI